MNATIDQDADNDANCGATSSRRLDQDA